jgi:hypothetical protein
MKAFPNKYKNHKFSKNIKNSAIKQTPLPKLINKRSTKRFLKSCNPFQISAAVFGKLSLNL